MGIMKDNKNKSKVIKLNRNDFAKFMQVTPRSVSKAINSGRIKILKEKNGREYIDRDQAAKDWYDNSDKSKISTKSAKIPKQILAATNKEELDKAYDEALNDEDLLTYNDAATLEKNYKALIAKLDYEIKAEKYIPIDTVAKVVEEEYSRVKARLRGIPNKVARDCALETDHKKIKELLSSEIDETLNELVGHI